MASSARSFLTNLALNPHHLPNQQSLSPPFSHHLIVRPLLPFISLAKRRGGSSCTPVVNCLISGVDGGGVSDDFVSTRKSGFGREFSVIANMLKRIEPLDTSVISKGVSDSAKDSMKQTISTMLGLLPSDQFSVTVRVSKQPLYRLIISSIVTGYTLWNAEYRISLMRNFDIPLDNFRSSEFWEENGVSELKREESEGGGRESSTHGCVEDSERVTSENLGDLSPEVLNYIQRLESELSAAKQELQTREQENIRMEYVRKSNNDLLDYLRSLEADMVIELSRPSSCEVEEVIHQLAQSALQKIFKDDITSEFSEDNPDPGSAENCNDNEAFHNTVGTSRDYLAKLLFWCMVLGHHLRGLENRLHLSCVVGLL